MSANWLQFPDVISKIIKIFLAPAKKKYVLHVFGLFFCKPLFIILNAFQILTTSYTAHLIFTGVACSHAFFCLYMEDIGGSTRLWRTSVLFVSWSRQHWMCDDETTGNNNFSILYVHINRLRGFLIQYTYQWQQIITFIDDYYIYWRHFFSFFLKGTLWRIIDFLQMYVQGGAPHSLRFIYEKR